MSQLFKSLFLFMMVVVVMIGRKGNLPLMWTPGDVGGLALPTYTKSKTPGMEKHAEKFS
jgi:hypothetical protein